MRRPVANGDRPVSTGRSICENRRFFFKSCFKIMGSKELSFTVAVARGSSEPVGERRTVSAFGDLRTVRGFSAEDRRDARPSPLHLLAATASGTGIRRKSGEAWPPALGQDREQCSLFRKGEDGEAGSWKYTPAGERPRSPFLQYSIAFLGVRSAGDPRRHGPDGEWW